MINIEQKAEALVNEVIDEGDFSPQLTIYRSTATFKALCRAIEQHEAFRQEVSDECIVLGFKPAPIGIGRFIIPAPNPDPLVDALNEALGRSQDYEDHHADALRDTLDALGFEIREKNDG